MFHTEDWGADKQTDKLISGLFDGPGPIFKKAGHGTKSVSSQAGSTAKMKGKFKEKKKAKHDDLEVNTDTGKYTVSKKKRNRPGEDDVDSPAKKKKKKNNNTIKGRDVEISSPAELTKLNKNHAEKNDDCNKTEIAKLNKKKQKKMSKLKKISSIGDVTPPLGDDSISRTNKNLKKKRKLQLQGKDDITDADEPRKKLKQENVCKDDPTEGTEVSKSGSKKKRKRKCKKNKYKHLAGVSKLARFGLDESAEVVGTGQDDPETQTFQTEDKSSSKLKNSRTGGSSFPEGLSVRESQFVEKSLVKTKKKKKKEKKKNLAEILSQVEIKTSDSSIPEGFAVCASVSADGEESVKSSKKKKMKRSSEAISSPVEKKIEPSPKKQKSTLFQLSKLRKVLHDENQDVQRTKGTEGLTETQPKQPFSEEIGENISQKDVKSKNKSNVETKPLTLREKLELKLNAARFRHLNETMYTCTGNEAYKMFTKDRKSFMVYHQGFQTQVNKWPLNPVERMIEFINKRPHSQVVADFGCGDAKIAQNVPHKVHSFDLVALNKHVTACDMSKVPLKPTSVDVAVFCLALMGTNLTDYLCEANRVLKQGGTLLIAEVISRFEKVAPFVAKLENLGFEPVLKDLTNKMFVWFEFKKTGAPKTKNLPFISLMPCVYKKR